jgi:hypothetical protein
MAAFAIAYSMAHPSEEGTREVGSRPVRVGEGPTYETPRLGRSAELPPLAPRPPEAAPVPVQVQVERAEPPRHVAIDRPRPVARTSAPRAAPPAPITPAAPPPPSPASVHEPPPPPPPPPPAPEPEAMTFDDSG